MSEKKTKKGQLPQGATPIDTNEPKTTKSANKRMKKLATIAARRIMQLRQSGHLEAAIDQSSLLTSYFDARQVGSDLQSCHLCDIPLQGATPQAQFNSVREHVESQRHRLTLTAAMTQLRRDQLGYPTVPWRPANLDLYALMDTVDDDIVADLLANRRADMDASTPAGFSSIFHMLPGIPFPHQRAAAGFRAARVAANVVEKVVQGKELSETEKMLSTFNRLDKVFAAAMDQNSIVNQLTHDKVHDQGLRGPIDLEFDFDGMTWNGTAECREGGKGRIRFKISLPNEHFLFLPPPVLALDPEHEDMRKAVRNSRTHHNVADIWYHLTADNVKTHMATIAAYVRNFVGEKTLLTPKFDLSVNLQRLDLEFVYGQFSLIIQFEPGVGKPLGRHKKEIF